MTKLKTWLYNLLGTRTLHNGMILSTFSISSRGFALCFPKSHHNNGDVFLTYKCMIIPQISQCKTHFQQSSTILSSNKVHHRASPEAYVALEQPSLNRDLTHFSETLEQSTSFVRHLNHLWLHVRGSQILYSTIENSINMTKLNAWLWYHVRNHDSLQCYDIVHF